MAFTAIAEEVTCIEIQELPGSFGSPGKTYLVIRQVGGETAEIEIDWANRLSRAARERAIDIINNAFAEPETDDATPNRELVNALAEIRDRHIPDQPAADNLTERDYIIKQYRELRRIATAALAKHRETVDA